MSVGSTRGLTSVSLLAAVGASLTGCAVVMGEAFKFGAQHTLGAKLGPCAASKDSVHRVHGAPYKRMVADEEDVVSGEQVFEHEWGYLLPVDGARDSVRTDSLVVVRFRWGSRVTGCEVAKRVARRETRRWYPPW